MKETLVLLAILFLAGQLTAASRGLVSRIRRNKNPRPMERK
jgi:hypothetical protein